MLKPLALFSILVLVFAAACSDSSTDDDGGDKAVPPAAPLTLNLGVVQSSTGSASIYGNTAIKGIELAIKQLESPDFQVEYTVVDDQSTADGGKAAFTGLAVKKVNAIIGPTLSGTAIAAFPIAQQNGIPAIGATTTADNVVNAGNMIFRTALGEATVVPPVLASVNGKTPVKQAVLFFDSTEAFSAGSATAMRKGLQAINANVVKEVDISKETDRSFLAAAQALQGTEFDTFLVTPLINDSAKIVKALRATGYTQTIVGGNSFNTLDLVAASDQAVNGAYVGAAWNPGSDNAKSRKFVADYTAAYGSAPDLYAAQGYAAVEVLVSAAKSAGKTDNESIRAALASAKNVDTIFGKISMSSGREAEYAPVVQQFQDGKLNVVK